MVGFTKRVITIRRRGEAKGSVAGSETRAVAKRKYPLTPELLAKAGIAQTICSDFAFYFCAGARESRLPAQDMRGLGTALA